MSETVPPPATESVQSFHKDLKRRLTKGAQLSWRDLDDRVGIPNSTIRGWLEGKKPMSGENLGKLLRGVGADDAEVEAWQARREAVAGLSTRLTQDGAVFGAAQRNLLRSIRNWRWWERIGLVAAGVVLGVVGTLLVHRDAGNGGGAVSTSEQKPAGKCGPVQLDLRSGSVATRISHTGNLGVALYRGPGSVFCREQNGLPEGASVRVVCQTLTGEAREDRREAGQLVRSPVWDKLDSGMWIPHIYTDLPMTDGSTLVAGLDRC